MLRQSVLRTTALLCCALLLCSCADAVETAQKARLPMDETVTIEQALARYPYFTSINWSSYTDKDDKRIVEAVCDLDVAATCRDVNGAGLKLARKDVARDYFVARFIVDGLPRKVRALEAQHVTRCTSGARLAVADPKYLRAIYNREQVRFFCLEGLNCPGADVQSGGAANAAANGTANAAASNGQPTNPAKP